jgi:hypothetical protein
LPAAFAALEVVLDLPDGESAQPGAILAVREPSDLGADEGVELGRLLVALGRTAARTSAARR